MITPGGYGRLIVQKQYSSILPSARKCSFIAILAGLLLPALSVANASAKAAKCKSNLRQIGLVLNLYVNDFAKYPLYYYHPASAPEAVGWNDFLLPYCGGSSNLFVCPSATGSGSWDMVHYDYNWRGTSRNGSELGLGGSSSLPWTGSLDELDLPLPESRVLVPSDMLAVFHKFWGEVIDAHLGFGWPGATWFGGKSFHEGGDLAVFCDGHVESSKSELLSKAHAIHFESWPSVWTFKPDEATAKRLNNDNEPHAETWPMAPVEAKPFLVEPGFKEAFRHAMECASTESTRLMHRTTVDH